MRVSPSKNPQGGVGRSLTGREVTGRCELLPGIMEGALEYAFYLLVEGRKSQMRWYEASPSHCFILSPKEAGKTVQLRGFVRAVADPEHKLSALSMPLETKPFMG